MTVDPGVRSPVPDCTFDGDRIVKARCDLDSAMVTWTIQRIKPLATTG